MRPSRPLTANPSSGRRRTRIGREEAVRGNHDALVLGDDALALNEDFGFARAAGGGGDTEEQDVPSKLMDSKMPGERRIVN